MGQGSSQNNPDPPVAVDWNGPMKKHTLTDWPCLLLFLAFLGGWGFVAYVAFTNGDISKVIHPTDSKGRLCGTDNLEHRTYLLFFDLTRCLNPAALAHGCLTPQVCVEECPTETLAFITLANSNKQDALNKLKPFCDPDYVSISPSWSREDPIKLIENGVCPAYVLESTPVLGRCMPGKPSDSEESYQEGVKVPGFLRISSFRDRGRILTGPEKEGVVFDSTETTDKKEVTITDLEKALYQLTGFLSVREYSFRFCEDLMDTWWMIGLALVGAAVLSYLWIILMRFLTGLMVWLSLFLIFVLIGSGFGYCTYRYILIMDKSSAQGSIFEINLTPDYFNDLLELGDTWIAFMIVIGVIFLIVLLLFIALRERISIAIKMIEQGSKAVGHMCSSLFFPPFPFFCHAGVATWFIFVGMYLSTSGVQEFHIKYENNTESPKLSCNPNDCLNHDNKDEVYALYDVCDPETFEATCNGPCYVNGKPTIVTCQFTQYQKLGGLNSWMMWFNLFGFYWAMNFVTSYGEMVLAGVFAKWYWTRPGDRSKIFCCNSCIPLLTSIKNTTVYHLGTIAFGSFLIAIIKIVRKVVETIESKLKKTSNDLTRCLFCVCKCCLCCLEKFMMFINRNAYIVCAVRSKNFFSSGKEAFTLIMNNAVRTFVLNKMVSFLLFAGRMVIVVGAGVVSYFVFAGYFPELNGDSADWKIPRLNYNSTPIICIVVGTYFITTSFFNVYSMAVDTIFLCFLQDLKQNDGTPQRPYFMSKGLRRTVGAMQKFKEEDLDKKIDYLQKERGLVKEMNLNGQEAVPMMAQTENINR